MREEDLGRIDVLAGHAAMEVDAWAPLIDSISTAMNARGGVLLPLLGTIPKLIATDGVAEVTDAYIRGGWSDRDGRSAGLPRLLRSGVLADPDVVPLDEMKRHAFWGDLLEPHGLWWSCGLVIRAGQDLWCLALQRTPAQGAFAPAEQASLQSLSASLSRSATLQRHLGIARLDGFSDALDHLGTAGFVLDRVGRVIRVNVAAEVLVGRVLGLRRGELFVVGRPDLTASLRKHFEATLWSEIAPGSPYLNGVAVPRSGQRPLFLQAHVLRNALLNPFAPGRALVLVTDPENGPLPNRAVLREMFSLTDSEARLVQALAERRSLTDAARRIGVSYETARSYLKAVFAKTGARNQSDLAALAARIERA